MTQASFKVSEFLNEISDKELSSSKLNLKKKKDEFIAALATKHLTTDKQSRTHLLIDINLF